MSVLPNTKGLVYMHARVCVTQLAKSGKLSADLLFVTSDNLVQVQALWGAMVWSGVPALVVLSVNHGQEAPP